MPFAASDWVLMVKLPLPLDLLTEPLKPRPAQSSSASLKRVPLKFGT